MAEVIPVRHEIPVAGHPKSYARDGVPSSSAPPTAGRRRRRQTLAPTTKV
jgi:hypothetical protein